MNSGASGEKLRNLLSGLRAEIGVTNLALLLLLAIILFYPLLFVGITTHDDAVFAISSDIWATTKNLSVGQGRFAFWWNYPLSQLPYVFDSRAWYLITKYGSFFVLLGALYFAVSRLFKSSWIALVTLTFYLAFIQNAWDHNALTSYPFSVNFFAALFLASLGLFTTAIEKKKFALACLAGAMYFLTLCTEFYVLFFPLYVAALLSRADPGESVLKQLRSGKKYLLAIALPLTAYLTIYLVWRAIFTSTYEGNRLDFSGLLTTVKVFVTYSLSALPFASLHFIASSAEQIPFVETPGLSGIISGLNAENFIKPAVAGLLFASLMTSANFVAPHVRTLKIGAALAFVSIFIPNLLLGFTQKHKEWLAMGWKSYLYTYHSFIAVTVFVALILAYLNRTSRAWPPGKRTALIAAGTFVVISVSFVVEVRNQYIAFDQKLSHRKWQLMDVVINSDAFKAIPDGSTVVAPTLGAHYRGIAYANNAYWTQYIKYKTGKNIQFADNACGKGAACYSLVFRQEKHADDQFVVLAKTKHPNLQDSSELTIYSLPNQTNSVIVGSFTPDTSSPQLMINGMSVANINAMGEIGSFSANLPHVPGEGTVQISRLSGNINIIPSQITISHFDVEPRLLSWSAELSDGIDFSKPEYPYFLAEVSGMSGYTPGGRWTDANQGPTAKFRFRHALPRKFILEISAAGFGPNIGAPVAVRVGRVEKSFVVGGRFGRYRLEFETDGSADTIEIAPPKPTIPHELDPASPDMRKLGIRFSYLKIIS